MKLAFHFSEAKILQLDDALEIIKNTNKNFPSPQINYPE